MTFTTDELRDALHTYAEEVPHPDATALLAGAHRKRQHGKRVRAAVIAGAAAVLMAVVTVIGIQGLGKDKALTPAQLNKKHHTHYAEYTHGLKLTDILEVPVRKVADDGDTPGPPKDASEVTLPKVGSAVYLACDDRTFMKRSANTGSTAPQVTGTHTGGTSCGPFTEQILSAAKPGTRERLWLDTPDDYTKSHASIAVYTQVPWDDYPVNSTKLRPKPEALNPKDPNAGDSAELFSGSGNVATTRKITVPANADSVGAALSIQPSTTGRFQVLVNGHAQRLDYTGLPAKYDWLGFGPPPEAHGTWFNYAPDSGSQNVTGLARLRAVPAGHSATITIRAVDTTGPWKAMLSWQKK